MNISKKIAIALECLIDFDEAQDILKDRWYGDTNTDDIPYERWSRTFFAQLPPRKGTMGFVNDMRDEGAQVVFFSNTDDPIQGERAERWLRDWTADAFSRSIWRSRARSTRMALFLFFSWLFSSCMATTTPLGRWVMRTAESIELTDCPPGPDER